MNESYTYYAFVSHSHRDAKWATWIQNALERYRLPSSVRKAVRKPLPKRLAPVFRDATDLGSCQLVEGLHRELEASRFLIVICSPDSAKPNAEGKHFVDHEVDYFAGLGRVDRIIPVIVSGTPEESFGPKIRELGLLALDATKASRARVLNDIVAKILGLRPDELWRRERRRQLIRRIVLCAAGVCAALLLVGGGLFAWDSSRQVVRYYADYVEAYGLPQGLFPLSPTDIPGRSVSYRFEYRGVHFGKCVHKDTSGPSFVGLFGFRRVLRRVVQEDSYGRPVDRESQTPEERPQILRFTEYAADGTLREARQEKYVCAGVEPRLVRRLVFKDEDGVVNGLVKFVDRQSRTAVFSPATMDVWKKQLSPEARCEVAQQLYARDEAGYVTAVVFLDLLGSSATDVDGLGGFRFERDELGRITRKVYLDAKGDPMAVRNGVAARSYDYANSRTFTETCEGLDGRPILNEEKWARRCDELDRYGNVLKSSYFDETGRLTSTRFWYAECRRTYDERGNLVKVRYFDEEDKPCLDIFHRINGYAAKFSQDGRPTEFSYFGTDGKPCLNKCELYDHGVPYDVHRLPIQKLIEEIGGSLPKIGGVAGWTMEWNRRGLCLAATSRGLCGERIGNAAGFAEVRLDYDMSGNPVEVHSYDDNGRSVQRVRIEYDGRGRMTQNKYVDFRGELRPTKDGYAVVKREYDSRGNQKAVRSFGMDWLPHPAGYLGAAGIEWEYDERGRMTRETFIGVDGKPTPSRLEHYDYPEERTEYDDAKNLMKCRYYGANGEPYLRDGCYFGKDMESDELGRLKRVAKIGADGRPTTNEHGVAEFRLKYDVQGFNSDMLHYDFDGEPCVDSRGIAGFKTDHDKYGRLTRIATFGADGRLKSPSAKHNVAASTFEYDESGNCTATLYFDANGKPTLFGGGYAESRSQYDVRGNCTSDRYYGVDGKLCLCGDGYAGWDAAFDDHSREVRHVWIGVDGKPMCGKDGYAEWRKEYDAYGNQTSLRYYGVDGKLCLQEGDNAGWNAEYDRWGREIRRVWFGVDGKPMCIKAGYAEMRKEYDSQGECTATRYYGVDGNPPRWKSECDSSGREIRRVWLDVDGKPMADADGVFEYRKSLDERGNCTAIRYYDAEGRPCRRRDDTAGWMAEYDAQGREIRHLWVDDNGLPTSISVRHDGSVAGDGGCIQDPWHDSEGRPMDMNMRGEDLCAEWRKEYDENGHCKKMRFYDSRGRLDWTAEYDEQGRLVRYDNSSVGYRKSYDLCGKRISLRFCDEKGNACFYRNYGVAGYDLEYDERGREIRHVWIGVDGKPMILEDGASGWSSGYDDLDREIRRVWLSVDGKPVRIKLGYAEYRRKLDAHGNCTSMRYYGPDGKPCLSKNAQFGWDAEYNSQGRKIRHVNIGGDGKPLLDEEFGFAEVRAEYNGRGACTSLRFYGPDGKPCESAFGCAGWIDEYDVRNWCVRETWIDVKGNPVVVKVPGLFAEIWNLLRGKESVWEKVKINAYGPCVYDNGTLNIFKQPGFAECQNEFDVQGNLVSIRYLDAHGKPIVAKRYSGPVDDFGFAECRRGFDAQGNCTNTCYYGADGKMIVVGRLGYAECKKTFDKRGNCTNVCYFGADGNLILNEESGFAECRKEFDERGNCTDVRYLDADGRLILHEESGFAECKKEFDERGNCTDVCYFGADGKLILNDESGFAECRKEFDERGNCTGEWYIGADGKPCRINRRFGFDSYDYARVITSYDSLGRLTRKRWFGVDGEPCSGVPRSWGEKICECRKEYDENGNATVHCYWEGGGEVKKMWYALRCWLQQELQQPHRSR